MENDDNLESMLRNIFEVGANKAFAAAHKTTTNEFYQNFSRLENMLGFENASYLVQHGDFLGYRNGFLETYFQLARVAIGKMDAELPIPVDVFCSIDSLEKYLGLKHTDSQTKDLKVNPTNYRLLHKDNPQSANYLKLLIEKGELIVGENDHWGKTTRTDGRRGLHIIRRISYELAQIFNEAEMERPQYKINHGQQKISLDENTRIGLSKIRDVVYGVQK